MIQTTNIQTLNIHISGMSCRDRHLSNSYIVIVFFILFSLEISSENKAVEILPQGVFTTNKKQQTILQDNLSV